MELARLAVATEDITAPYLVDDYDNPVWCSYGPAPNIAYLIGRDGTIVAKQGWFDPAGMEAAIQDYLSQQ